jgi:hypothetical protein
MGKAKRKAKPKAKPENLEALSSDDLMRRIFGPEGQEVLKLQADTASERVEHDYRLPDDTI